MTSSNSPCAACKFLRRKCTQGCVFAPYFPPDQPSKFSDVHRVFGASNVAKLLNDLNPTQREDAVNSLAFEASARLKDPVYGCVGYISLLQQRLKQVKQELYSAKKELSTYIGPMVRAPNFIPQSGYPYPALIPPASGMLPPFGIPGIGIGLGLMAPGESSQVQPHMLAAEAEAKREHELLIRNYDHPQRQYEFARINSGFGSGGGRGFNEMGGDGDGDGTASIAIAPPPGQTFGDVFHVHQHFPEQQQQHGSDEHGSD